MPGFLVHVSMRSMGVNRARVPDTSPPAHAMREQVSDGINLVNSGFCNSAVSFVVIAALGKAVVNALLVVEIVIFRGVLTCGKSPGCMVPPSKMQTPLNECLIATTNHV